MEKVEKVDREQAAKHLGLLGLYPKDVDIIQRWIETGDLFQSEGDFDPWQSKAASLAKAFAEYRATIYEWQPMKTAPVDGTQILLQTDERVYMGSWSGQGDWWIERDLYIPGDAPLCWLHVPVSRMGKQR